MSQGRSTRLSRLSRHSNKKASQPAETPSAPDLHALFDEVLDSLNIGYSIKETDFKHVFKDNKITGDITRLCSPYMIVRDENDKVALDASTGWVLPDGRAPGYAEDQALKHQQLPGVNDRFGMPAKETKTKAVREADQEAILQYCGLPAAMTKRCLILKAFERMMLKQQPEQSFHFLDRNFVEEFNDKATTRQVLSQTLTQMTPDVVTEYYDMLDGLLVAMYHKNPPGRLLRD